MIYHILIASFVCLGFNAATWDGMIFDKPTRWLQANLPYWINKPTWMCPICMASIWGTCYYLGVIDSHNLKDWAIFVLSIAGFNSIVIRYAK